MNIYKAKCSLAILQEIYEPLCLTNATGESLTMTKLATLNLPPQVPDKQVCMPLIVMGEAKGDLEDLVTPAHQVWHIVHFFLL